jgi:hypothetical protein
MKPVRIQRKRTKGWKMPENTVCVTRPGKWGNSYHGEDAIQKFEDCILNNVMTYFYIENKEEANKQFYRFKWMSENLHLLKGKNLACFCKFDKPCHSDVLLRLANK